MDKCKSCPVAEACGKPCVAQLFNTTSLCDKVNPDHPDFKEAYRTLVADKSCGTHNYVPTTQHGSPQVEKKETQTEVEINGVKAKIDIKQPSLWSQAKSFGKSMVDYAASGFANTTDEEYAERMGICEKCEHYTSEGRCDICNCVMGIKAKLCSAECPIKKWLAIHRETKSQNPSKPCGGCGR